MKALIWLTVVLWMVIPRVTYGDKPIPIDEVIPRLETALQRLVQQPMLQLQKAASAAGVHWSQGRLRVAVECNAEMSEGAITKLGGDILTRDPQLNLLEVDIPASELIALAQLPGVEFVRRLYHPKETAVSEGIMVTGASKWHQTGIRGQGTKVAIIDGGFTGLSSAIAAGELDNVVFTRDYTGDGLEMGGVHGTACAEIVHDMAPDVQLILLKISTEMDLYNAVGDAISQGANVISHSMGWFNTNFYDGTGPIAQIAQQAIEHGMLWVNSAGNSADGGHWEGNWSDPDNDGWLDFHNGDEVDNFPLEAGETVELYLTWDAWPLTDQDYDLHLVDSTGRTVASSENWQTGTQEPRERISYTARVDGNYGVAIYDHGASVHPRLELFAIPYHLPMEYSVAASSIPAPANARVVFTVGAIDWQDWGTGPQEAFSSQGPTNASNVPFSVVKPDICGPDGTTSTAYQDAFYGTSASAPHVAGAAALVWSVHPSWPADEVRLFLENAAIDIGEAGKDNIYGYGRLHLSPPSVAPVKYHTYGTVTGWYMVSVPLNSGTAADLFGTTAWTYNPAMGQYEVASTIEPAKGYWVYLPANKSVTDSGSQVTTDVTIDISAAGWYQLSSPWVYPKSAIQVAKGPDTKPWADAVAAGWVRDDIYGYQAPNGAYTTPTTLDPWYGYWINALVSGLSLIFRHAGAPPPPPMELALTMSKESIPAGLPPMPSAPSVRAADLVFGNYPNPVTDVYTTTFAVKDTSAELVEAIKVDIYDLSGRLVYSSGEIVGTSVDWHTDNDHGEYLANGVYLYKMYAKVAGQWIVSKVKKIAILR